MAPVSGHIELKVRTLQHRGGSWTGLVMVVTVVVMMTMMMMMMMMVMMMVMMMMVMMMVMMMMMVMTSGCAAREVELPLRELIVILVRSS